MTKTLSKKVPKQFVPFAHDNLEIKNELIDYARTLKQNTLFEGQLASTFIYASFAEYLASHLLENLRFFTYQGNYNYFGGIIFCDERKDTKLRTMGDLVYCVDKYSFPDKSAIVELFKNIGQARNNIFHNFAKSDLTGLKKIIEVDMKIIQDSTEELLSKINVIYNGLQKILLVPQPQTQTNGTTP